MPPSSQNPRFGRVRTVFRWCRIFIWLVLLAAVGAIAYLHLIGLPDFLKQSLLGRLRAQEISAQFAGMRLDWKYGPAILIDNVSFSRLHQPLSPRLSAGHAELILDWDALLHARLQVRVLQVVDGSWELPVSDANRDSLILDKLAMDVRFDTNDTARVDVCRGVFHGVQIDLIGIITHVSALPKWQYQEGGTNIAPSVRLRDTAHLVQKIHFTGTPVLEVEAEVDGQNTRHSHAELRLRALGARTPWGQATRLDIKAACVPREGPASKPFLQLDGTAVSLSTSWGAGRKVSFFTAISHAANSNLDAAIHLDATQVTNNHGVSALNFSWNGSATLASSNFIPLRADGKLRVSDAQTPWGSARVLSLDCNGARATNAPPAALDWGAWAGLAPWILDWQADLHDATGAKLALDSLTFSGHWQAPVIAVENLRGELYGGHVEAGATLDIASRELRCHSSSDFDPHSISPLLKPAASNWLAQLEWETPPKASVQMRVVLNPWTNRPAKPSNDMASTLQLAGDFAVGPASFRGVRVLSAAASVAYTNGLWSISHLHAARPDGGVDLDCASSLPTQEYRFTIDSHLDPRDALPLLGLKMPPAVGRLDFTQPPAIHAEVRGSWDDPGRISFTASVQATNFTLRGESFAALAANVIYTNLLLTVRDLRLSGTECQVQAPWLQADLKAKTGALSNVLGAVGTSFLGRFLRDNPPDFLRSVRFDEPATVSAFGTFSFTNDLTTDLHFQVTGRGFHYNTLSSDTATGQVSWIGESVYLTNIVAGLYNGTAMGWLSFISIPGTESVFSSDFTVRDIDLSPLATDIAGRPKHVEGRLDGDLIFGGPNTSDKNKWSGYGHVHVHDALLWDIKVFGLLSPVLNLFSPGWGHSRAREATADFSVTNGIISSSNLLVRCTGFRLNVHGTVTLDKKINARFEARLAREAPVIGPVLSFAFTPLSKLFEYHISGTLQEPVMEPVYVPHFVTFLLHPFRSLKTPASPEPSPAPNNNNNK